MTAAPSSSGVALPKQEWNVRWLAILIATALLAGAAGYDVIFWVDAKGTLHGSGRPDCLPQPGQKSAVQFGAVQWTHEGVTRQSVVWVDCRS